MSDYIVMDLEWNQNPSFHHSSLDDALPFEIIEIGAVKLNEKLEMVSEFRRLIRPQVYRRMHKKIAEVTHLTMEQLNREGEDFPDVMADFLEWCGDDYYFCIWGTMDITELQRNMLYHGLDIPFEIPVLYYDLQKIYGLIKGIKASESLDKAVEEYGIPESRPFHRALDDAWYTAAVMQRMGFFSRSQYISVDYFQLPEDEEDEFYLEFPDYVKLVSHPFGTREEILEDKHLTRIICPECRRALRKKIMWFSTNQRYYYSIAWCPEHNYVQSKIRIKKTEDGDFFAVKTTKLVDQNAASAVADRRDSVRKKRAERNRKARQAAREARASQLTAQANPSAAQGEKQAGRAVIRRTRRRRMMDR